jgi:uncharacterized protein (TIGR02117 family)
MRKFLKIVLLVISQLLTGLFTLLVSLFVYTAIGQIAYISPESNNYKELEVVIRSNGFHTDIIMPVKTDFYNWSQFLDTSDLSISNQYNYVAIGWGDKGFYLKTPSWNDLTVSTIFKALFVPSSAVMHVEFLEKRTKINEQNLSIKLSASQYNDLVIYIKSSFKIDQKKPELITGYSYFGTDQFYEAKGSYHLFETCNSWTNGALKSARVKTAVWAIFPDAAMAYQK